MPEAYVAINAVFGSEDAIVGRLNREYAGSVRYIGRMNGVYDILTKLYSDSAEGLNKIVHEIGKMDEVRSRIALVVKSSEKI